MTDANRTKKRLELLDVDGDDDEHHDIHTHQQQQQAATATAAVIHNTNNRTASTSNTPVVVVATTAVPTTKPNLFQLPDGRIMDSKNTLQSFDDHQHQHRGGVPTVVPVMTPPPPLELQQPSSLPPLKPTTTAAAAAASVTIHQGISEHPTNDVMMEQNAFENVTNRNNNKNNNNSDNRNSNNIATTGVVGVTTTAGLPITEVGSIRNNNTTNNIITNNRHQSSRSDTTDVVHAEAVLPLERPSSSTLLIVNAEIADSRLDLPRTTEEGTVPVEPPQKSGLSFRSAIAFAMIIAWLATGIGVICGNGNCGSGGGSNSTNPSPPTPSNDNTPVSPPKMISKNGQFRVACKFLMSFNLTTCQRTTRFNDATWGNTIPTEIGLLTQLTYLDLNLNQLTGTIPYTLGNLMHLTYLNLDNNQLTGTIVAPDFPVWMEWYRSMN